LPYACQGEGRADRLRRKARSVRARLGASNNLTVPVPYSKPKHMRWETFWRLRELEMAANMGSLLSIPESLKRQMSSVT